MKDTISLTDLIKRDLKTDKISGKYQIQSGENCDFAKIIKFDKEISDFCIHEHEIDEFKCSLIQYTLTDDDIENKRLKIIGFLIRNKNNNNIICSLDLEFIPTNNIIVLNDTMKGEFNVLLINNKNEKKVIKNMKCYVGNVNVIYMMMELLTECLVMIINEN